jgi:hypothetical protein
MSTEDIFDKVRSFVCVCVCVYTRVKYYKDVRMLTFE